MISWAPAAAVISTPLEVSELYSIAQPWDPIKLSSSSISSPSLINGAIRAKRFLEYKALAWFGTEHAKSDAPISDPLPDRSKPKPNAREKRIAGYQKKIQSLQKRRDKMSKDSLKKGIQKTIDGYRQIIKKMRS